MERIRPVRRMQCECGCGELANFRRRFVNGHNSVGRSIPPEVRKKISESLSGENHPMYGKRGKDTYLFGKKMSAETKLIQSKARIGFRHSRYAKRKIGLATLGRVHSDATKRKISKSAMGRTMSEETRIKLSKINRGKFAGDKHWNWRGGSDKSYCPIWNLQDYRDMIFERDNYDCQNPLCWRNGTKLCRHHIDYDISNCDLSNVISVCLSCNSRANTNRRFWQEHYQNIMKDKLSL